MNEKKIADVCARVLALRKITTMNTTRSQNVALQSLTDNELGVAALKLQEAE
jgi:hypothetical protein